MSIEVDGLGLVHPNGHRALRGVSLAAKVGEQVAVIGPSGAGKTTLLRLLDASLRPSDGRVGVLGANPWRLSARALQRLRARIGLVHQAPPIPPRLRVVTAVLAGRLGTWSLGRALASLAYPQDIPGAPAALARLDLAHRPFDPCDPPPGGPVQRRGLAPLRFHR